MKRYLTFSLSLVALCILHTSYANNTSTITDYTNCSYQDITKDFKEKGAWGLHTTVDIKNCDLDLITSSEKIQEFAIKLCDLIKMNRYGEPIIINFGQCEEVAGYTLLQPIETSSITVHFVNKNGNAYFDIFSCKLYDPHIVAEFIKEFFKGNEYIMHVLLRI